VSRSQITILLLLLTGLAILYGWQAMPKQRRIATKTNALPVTTQLSQSGSSIDVSVSTDLDFHAGANKFNHPKKNLFGPLYLKKTIKKINPRNIAKQASLLFGSINKNTQVKHIPHKTKQNLDVLGFIKKNSEYTVFLSSKNGEIFIVKDGDNFAKNLIVDKITSVDIAIKDQLTNEQFVLSLSESNSQRLPRAKFKSGRQMFTAKQDSAIKKSQLGKQMFTAKQNSTISKSQSDLKQLSESQKALTDFFKKGQVQ